jgi:HSP20 family protein
VLRMQRDMDRIYSRMGMVGQGGQGSQGGQQESWMPRIDIKQRGDDLQIRAELPGMKPEDVDIEFSDGVLTVRGERRMEEETEEEGWLVRESSYGSFERTVVLPESIDPESISAEYNDGVLEVSVPKALEKHEPQRLKISVGGEQQGGAQKAMGSGGQQGDQQASQQAGQHQKGRGKHGEPGHQHAEAPEGAREQEGRGAYSSGHEEAENAQAKPGESHQQPAEGSREKAHV